MLVSNNLDTREAVVIKESAKSLSDRDFLSSSEDAGGVGWVVIARFVLKLQVYNNDNVEQNQGTDLDPDGVDRESLPIERLHGLQKVVGIYPGKHEISSVTRNSAAGEDTHKCSHID